jgi:hypothetical protein
MKNAVFPTGGFSLSGTSGKFELCAAALATVPKTHVSANAIANQV